ncbi:MAG: porin family protein [Bacteroidota bacterium]
MPFFLLLFCLSFTALQAQYFGIRGGYNWTDAKIELSNAEVETGSEGNLMLGLFVDIPVGGELLSIQPELNYMGRGYTLEGQFIGGVEIEQNFAYIDLGALAKLNFGTDEAIGFYLGAGPFFNYALSGTKVGAGGEQDIDFDADRIKRGELSFAAAAGITLGGFFVEARYIGSFTDQSDIDTDEIRQRSIGINAGFRVPLD